MKSKTRISTTAIKSSHPHEIYDKFMNELTNTKEGRSQSLFIKAKYKELFKNEAPDVEEDLIKIKI